MKSALWLPIIVLPFAIDTAEAKGCMDSFMASAR